MYETLAVVGLKLSGTPIFCGLLIGALFTRLREDVLRCVPLLLMSILLNGFLKGLIGKPLAPHLVTANALYSMPSGHIQSVALLWTYVAWEWRRIPLLSGIAALVMTWVGWALVFRGYHDWADVFGGIGVGAGLSITYLYMINLKHWRMHFAQLSISMAIIATALAPFTLMDSFKMIMLGLLWAWSLGVLIWSKGWCRGCTITKA